MKLSYFIKVMNGIRPYKLKKCIDLVHKRSGKNKALIFLDMAQCALRYGSGYNDYMIFEFYRLNNRQRSTYMTRFKNKKLINMMNDQKYTYIFDRKNEFYKRFRKYLGREFLDLSDCTRAELREFLQKRQAIIAKPSEGECGKGIEKIYPGDFHNIEEACDYLLDKANGFGVVEDVIIQHNKLSELYPYSINCFRMVTLLHDGKPHMLYAVLKTGSNGNFVDNLESGGFACHFDIKKGEICGPGHTSSTDTAEVHPTTGVCFTGFKVPYVKEAVELAKKAALEVPQVRYIGWDICITSSGPAIIEGNNYAAYDFPQLPDEGRERVGLLKQIRDIGVNI